MSEIEEIKEKLDDLIIKQIKRVAWVFFFNLLMIIWYEHSERTIFHIVLQTVHIVALVILIGMHIPSFKSIIKLRKKIKKYE